MHPLSHRWRIAAVVVPLVLLAACSRDATPVSPDQFQRIARDVLSDGPLAYNIIGELELQVGQQSQLKTRNSRNVRGATWTSSNPSVASVNTSGVVTGVAAGESFVTLGGFGVSETYRVGVTPTPTVTDLSISPATGTALAPGQSRQFTRSVTWSDGATRAATVTYSVSNAGAGTINSNGLFTAGQLAGTFSIIASCACGGVTPLADTAQVVIASLSSLAISPRTVTVAPGGTQAFSASALWSNGATMLPGVTYSTPSSSEGTVTATGGLYTAPTTPGTYRVILAQVGGPARDTAMVTVPAPQLTSLVISPKTASLAAGATQQFTASANWSTGATTLPPVTWSVIGGGTVSSTGLYTAPGAAGTYRVVVAHNGGTLRDTATVTVTGSAVTLTSIAISPKTTSLNTGGTRQFSASAVWSNGSTTLPAVTYSVIGGGTVSSSGLYTAPATAGTHRVVVAGSGRADTATVTVTSTSGGTLTSLTISPKTSSLSTGSTRQFSVLAQWSNGSTMPPSVTYSTALMHWTPSGPGTVSSSGLYTAPSSAGIYYVIVAQNGGTLRDTAEVTVTAPSSLPLPPTAGNAACPNEPLGYTPYGDITFSGINVPAQWGILGTDRELSTEPGPFAPTSVAFKHEAGRQAGQIGIFETALFPTPPRRVYSCTVFRQSANYVQHPSGTKFIYTPETGNGTRPIQFQMLPLEGLKVGGKFRWRMEMQSDDPTKLYNDNVVPSSMTPGRWYRLEFLAIMNTPGIKNGTLVWWTSEWNGSSWTAPVLNAHYNNVLISNASFAGTWRKWEYNLYYGGADSNTLTADQFIMLNRVRVAIAN